MERRRSLRRQRDDHNFSSLILLEVAPDPLAAFGELLLDALRLSATTALLSRSIARRFTGSVSARIRSPYRSAISGSNDPEHPPRPRPGLRAPWSLRIQVFRAWLQPLLKPAVHALKGRGDSLFFARTGRLRGLKLAAAGRQTKFAFLDRSWSLRFIPFGARRILE
jgi:hypothetical protein